MERVYKYVPILVSIGLGLASATKELSPYVNGFNLTLILVLGVPVDWYLGIAWRRHQGKKVLSRWSLVWALLSKAGGALFPMLVEVVGLLFGTFFLHWFNHLVPAYSMAATTTIVFELLAIVIFLGIGYNDLLSMVANWYLSGHAVPDRVYDWARDEIIKKLHETEDSEPSESAVYNRKENENEHD
ncbi:hypothetical protein [Weissella confusa]|uniref:hypothetical protein n=1 Tax=Weissella confusa TaxID=1583 RepID=UPI00223AE4F7|nr:hypothetical protein [Weissella confusa]MCS9991251.1 hypothetical protein [Weissella confusa]